MIREGALLPPRRVARGSAPPHRLRCGAFFLGLVTAAAVLPGAVVWAQEQGAHHPVPGGSAPGPAVRLGAMAIPLLTHARPAMAGEALTEAYLTQPMFSATYVAGGGRWEAHGLVNLEGVTLRSGELNAGIWGEGFYDRRHPHTWLHELVASVRLPRLGPVAGSLTAGRGFVPFGTDDPMVRGLVKYPANHHLAQVLERLVLVGAVGAGPLALEAALFNGDEPTGPSSLGTPERFGDSWSVRGTLWPARVLELQGSHARVHSPEHRPGSGLDQLKWSASARAEWVRPGSHDGARRYVLLEWARTRERSAGISYQVLDTWLGEGSLRVGAMELAARLERTDRPEEERLLGDPFRTPRPHMDVHLLGTTRWTIASAAATAPALHAGPLRVRPFLEVSRAAVRETSGSIVFDPRALYGATRLWSFSVGTRLEAGRMHARMGRYGAALPEPDEHRHRH